jgi:Arc/MetJ-type ribon-helix-helix transcriptional regulator
MTIEITRPETELLIQECLESGRFHNLDELLVEAVAALREKNRNDDSREPALPRKSLLEVFQSVRGLADDLDFSRNRSA